MSDRWKKRMGGGVLSVRHGSDQPYVFHFIDHNLGLRLNLNTLETGEYNLGWHSGSKE